MKNGIKIALLLTTAIAAMSSVLFLKQGGFGGGHGDFDKIIFILGLPWVGMPWPASFSKHDFIWLIGLPFCLNIATILLITTGVRARRQSDPPVAN